MNKKVISWILASTMAFSTIAPVASAANITATVSVDQNIGDYTYFNSNYHNVSSSTYSKTTISVDEGNTVDMGAFDYKNPDKVKNIVLNKTAAGMCSIAVYTGSRQLDFEQSKRYKHFGISTEFRVTSEETSLDLIRLKNRKENTTLSTTVINGTEITYADGSTSSIELDKWYTYFVSYNVNTDEVEMYLNGELMATSRFESDRLDDVITSIEGETGSAELLNYDITAYEKAVVNGVPEKTSVFVDSSEAENLLNQYRAAFHAYSGVYYADGEKTKMQTEPVYEEGEIYISLADFNSALGVNAVLTKGILSKGSETMNLNNDIRISEGIELIPVQRACKLFAIKTYTDGHGMVIADDEKIQLENNDHWNDIYQKEMVEDGWYKGTAFELSDVRMMNWYLLYERPSAETLERTFNANTANGEQHPRLLINNDKIAEIKELAKSDSYYSSVIDGFISEAESVMNEDVVSFDSIYGDQIYRTNSAAEDFEVRVKQLAFAYLLTEDTKYAERAIQDLIAVSEFPDFNYSHIIDSGMWSAGLAFGYDWLYNYMYDNGDIETIDKIANAIIRLEIEPVSRVYYAGLPGNATTGSMNGGGLQSSNVFARWKSNYGAYANSGMIISALAVAERNPGLCFDAIEKALRSYEYVLCGFETGEWLEGQRYWYSIQSDIAYSVGSLISVMGTDYNLLAAPGMKEQSENIINYTSLNSRFCYGDDSNCMTRYFARESYSFFADYYDLPQVAIMRKIKLSPELRRQFGSKMMHADPSILDIVYYMPEATISDLDAIPNIYVGDGSESFIVHEDFCNPNALFFASAGGPTTFYHDHNDGGNFIFDLGGETWAYELGASSYNVGTTTTRYTSRTEGHNTLTINPDSGYSQQAGSFADLVAHSSNKKGAYAVYDMTSLYHDAQSVQRGFYIDDNYTTITVRDEMSFSSNVDGYWFMHTDADIQVVNDSLVKLTKNNKTLYMQISVEGATSYTVKDMDAVHLDSSVAPSGEQYDEDVRKVAINFKGSDVAVTVRMALSQGVINTTPIADRIHAGGGMESVWSQDFEDCTTVDDAGFAEITTKESPKSTKAVIAESGMDKYLELEMTNADSGTAVFSAGTVDVAELGISDNSDFTVSYNVKFNPYDAETGKSSAGKYVEYLLAMGDNASGEKGFRSAYITYRAENNNSAPIINNGCLTNDNCSKPASGVKSLYAGAWNNIQWVVHRTDGNGQPLAAADMYADVYINGEYSATVGIRNGETMRRAVFAISLNEGVKYGKMFIDDIEIFKGSYDKQNIAKFAKVRLIDADFSDMIASSNGASDVSATPMIIGTSKISADGTEAIIETKKGVYGKSIDDKAMHLQRTTTSSSTSLDTRLEFKTDFGKLYDSGDSLEISVDFAFDEKIAPLCLTAQLIKEDGSLKKMVDFIKISGDYIKILNENHIFDLTPALIPGKWYNLKIVFASGDGESTYNSVTAYLDGEVIVDGPSSTKPDGQAPIYIQNHELTDFASAVGTVEDGFDRIKGIDYLWVHFKNQSSSTGKGMYVDNLEMTKYIGGALPKTIYTKLPITSAVVPASFAQRGTVFTDTTTTVSEVLNMFDMTRAKDIIVRDAKGNEITNYDTVANGKYVEIKSNDNNRYYATMDGTNNIIANVPDLNAAMQRGGLDKNMKASEVVKGAGRASGDKSILVESIDGNKGAAYVDLFARSVTYSDAIAYKPITAEVSVMPLNNSKIEVQLYTHFNTRDCNTSGSPYRGGITPVYFENGMIYGKNSSYPIMPYETGKWYKIAITMQPGTQKMEVRIDGEFVEETGSYTVRKYPAQFVSQLKLIVYDSAVFDDVKIYNGKHIEEEIPYITSVSEDAIIDNDKIYIPEDTSISDITDYLDFACGMPTGIYSDSTLSEPVAELEDGCVLVIENDGIYKEYQIYMQDAENETDCICPTVKDNVYSAYAVPTDSNAKLIIASYVGGRLDKVAFGTQEQGSDKINASLNVTKGSTVKMMLINLKTMKPLSKTVTYVNGVIQ